MIEFISFNSRLNIDKSLLEKLQVLHAFRSSSTAIVRNAKSGKIIHELKGKPGSITALAISREYHIVAVRLHYMELHEIFQLELYDIR